ncbi:MAG: GNAT family N-acetyltransferase [Anaerolineae bacterium]|nr:GNAT family N-acetyltransferase [Anaerolineae bacterium]
MQGATARVELDIAGQIVYNWHDRVVRKGKGVDEKIFCPHCGIEMEKAPVAGRVRRLCKACGFVLYRNPVPGAGVLVEMEGGIVLVQRKEPPFAGWWALPAGYIEADESVEQAAIRECKEETGLDVELVELFGVDSFPEGPVQSGIIIFYRARPVGGTMRAGDDAQDVRVFAPDDLPQQLAFRTHRQVIERWIHSRSPQFRAPRPGILIREARCGDTESVLQLLQLIPHYGGMSEEEQRAAAQRLRESPALEILVVEAAGKAVGFLALTFMPSLTGLRALIGEISVNPDFQRQGIGAALVEAAAQRATHRGATHLLVDTSRGDAAAQEFYHACGFEAGGVAPLRIR